MRTLPKTVLTTLAAGLAFSFFAPKLLAQQGGPPSPRQAIRSSSEGAAVPASDAKAMPTESSPLTEHERYLLARIEQLERRLAELEARGAGAAPVEPARAATPDTPPAGAGPAPQELRPASAGAAGFFQEATLNFTLDSYYGYNFNRPTGHVNLLRAYDVLSNSFSLNQAAVIFERAAKPAAGKRFGLRLDLQYGQATETLQGSAANEPRPQAYRPIFQAYGTYIVPAGSGLTVDYGKWASAQRRLGDVACPDPGCSLRGVPRALSGRTLRRQADCGIGAAISHLGNAGEVSASVLPGLRLTSEA